MNPKRTSFPRPVLGLLVLAGTTSLWANRDTWAADGEPRTPWQMNATPNPPASRSSSGAPAGSWAAQQMEIQRVNQERLQNRLREIRERGERFDRAMSVATPLVQTLFNRMDRVREPLPEPSYRTYTAPSYTPPATVSPGRIYTAAPVMAAPVPPPPPPTPVYSSEGHFVLEDDGVKWVGPYTGKHYKIRYDDIARDANEAFHRYIEHEREYQRKAGVPVIPPNPSDDFRDEQIHAIDRATAYVEELKKKTNPPPPPKPIPPLPPPPKDYKDVDAWYEKNKDHPDAERTRVRLRDEHIEQKVDEEMARLGEEFQRNWVPDDQRPLQPKAPEEVRKLDVRNSRYDEHLFAQPESAPAEQAPDTNPKDQPYRSDRPTGKPADPVPEEALKPWEEPSRENVGPLSWLDEKKKEGKKWLRDTIKTYQDLRRKWDDPLDEERK